MTAPAWLRAVPPGAVAAAVAGALLLLGWWWRRRRAARVPTLWDIAEADAAFEADGPPSPTPSPAPGAPPSPNSSASSPPPRTSAPAPPPPPQATAPAPAPSPRTSAPAPAPPSAAPLAPAPSLVDEAPTAPPVVAAVRPARAARRAAPSSPTIADQPAPEAPALPSWLDAALRGAVGERFRDVQLLGAGGMGAVVAAEDQALGQRVAVKVMPPHLSTDPKLRSRFYREARALACLSHPNVARVLDIPRVPDHETPVLVMQRIDGQDLMALYLEAGAPRVNDTLRWTVQAAAGLDHAHQHGVVHRDVKPSNLMVAADRTIRVVDFGLAKMEGATQVTISGERLGSVAYMPPEQMRGEVVGPAADQYALAVTAYFLFSGTLPFQPEDTVREAAPALSSQRPGLPVELDPVIARALAPQAASRYESCAAFGRQLMEAARRAAGAA